MNKLNFLEKAIANGKYSIHLATIIFFVIGHFGLHRTGIWDAWGIEPSVLVAGVAGYVIYRFKVREAQRAKFENMEASGERVIIAMKFSQDPVPSIKKYFGDEDLRIDHIVDPVEIKGIGTSMLKRDLGHFEKFEDYVFRIIKNNQHRPIHLFLGGTTRTNVLLGQFLSADYNITFYYFDRDDRTMVRFDQMTADRRRV